MLIDRRQLKHVIVLLIYSEYKVMVKSIFFVCDHLKGGGAERINLELANEFLTKGYRVYIFLL